MNGWMKRGWNGDDIGKMIGFISDWKAV